MFRKTTHMLAVSGLAAAIVGLVFAGVQLSGLAQVSNVGPGNLSGTINSVAQDLDGENNVIGGEWTLSLDGDNVNDFSADLEMASADGTGSHTHRIVLSDSETGIASTGEATVTLLPTEQSIGGTVLVNTTGLAESSDVTVQVDDMIAGTPESDEEGNLLYALGITENMTGSVTVNVEDAEGNSGSATLSVVESASNETSAASTPTNVGNLTGMEGNTTAQDIGNTTLSTTNTTAQDFGNTTLSTTPNMTTSQSNSSSNVTVYNSIQGYVPPPESGVSSSNMTTVEEPSATVGDTGNMTSSTDVNGTTTSSANASGTTTSSPTDNLTSTQNESSIVAETNGNITTFEAVVDIYSNDEVKWTDVDITVSILNGEVITIEIDPEQTDGHFGQEPIYGLVKSDSE